MQIYVHRNNQQLGPFSPAELKVLVQAGTISLLDPVWWAGQSGWMPLSQTSLAAEMAPGATGLAVGLPGPHSSYQRTSNFAIWSLVCGVSAFVCGLTFIPAIILGHLGLSEIKREPSVQGRGMALTGLILGYVVLALYIVVFGLYAVFAAVALQSGGFKSITTEVKSVEKDDSDKDDDSDSSTNKAPSDSNTNPAVTP